MDKSVQTYASLQTELAGTYATPETKTSSVMFVSAYERFFLYLKITSGIVGKVYFDYSHDGVNFVTDGAGTTINVSTTDNVIQANCGSYLRIRITATTGGVMATVYGEAKT